MRVIPIRENRPAAPEHAVHRLGNPDRQPLNAAREGDRVSCLYDQVQVIRLHGEVDDPETIAVGCLPDARRNDAKALAAAEPCCFVAHARRHVERVPRC